MKSLLPRNVFEKLGSNVREYGVREAVERSGVWMAERLLRPTIHRNSRATLAAFAESALSMHFSPDDLVANYLLRKSEISRLSQLKSEYEALSAELAVRYGERKLAYPQCYAVEQGSAFLLYAMVRSLRPETVLETGVANGHSSFFILNAMRANDYGVLHSIECSPDVGSLLGEGERKLWNLHVLDTRNLKKSFSQILVGLPPLDLFLHDSDHSHAWQAFELAAALKRLSPRGLIASDDCDGCFAFLDVCRGAHLQPVVLVEKRKVFGLAFKQLPMEVPTAIDWQDSTKQTALAYI